MTEPPKSSVEGDLLIGINAIATHLGITVRQALHLKEAHSLPTFKMGKSVCASRAKLTAHIRSLAGAVAAEMDAMEEGQ